MKRLKQRGVTLLEVLLAIAILGMLSGGLVSMMNQANYLVHDSTEILNARLKANEVMESLRSRAFEQLRDYSSLAVSETQPMTVDVEVTNFHELPTLKKVLVRVTWMNRKGHEKHFLLTTLRSKYSPHTPLCSPDEDNDVTLNSTQQGGRQ